MKKSFILFITIVLVLSTSVALLCSCDNNGGKSNKIEGDIIISFYYDNDLLGTYGVKKNTKFSEIGDIKPLENEEYDNFHINTSNGTWYTDSSCTKKFDPDEKITKELSLYLKKEEADKANKKYLQDYIKNNGSINTDGNYFIEIYTSNKYTHLIESYTDSKEPSFSMYGLNQIGDVYLILTSESKPTSVFVSNGISAESVRINSYKNHKIGDDYEYTYDTYSSYEIGMLIGGINQSIDYLSNKTKEFIFPFDIYDMTPIK